VERFPLISNIRLLDDGKLLLGGSFSSFGGEDYHCLVRLQPQPVGTNNAVKKEGLRLFPNPASGSFAIQVPAIHAGLLEIEIFDLSGRLVHAKTNHPSDAAIEIEKLQAGVYVVKAQGAEGVYSGKLVVE